MSGWQPIETAPKDGTVVLIFDPSGVPAPYADLDHWPTVTIQWLPAYWGGRDWLTPVTIHGGYPSGGPEVDFACAQPTHWMPLLAPPEEEK